MFLAYKPVPIDILLPPSSIPEDIVRLPLILASALFLALLLLAGGIALFFWMLKQGRLSITPAFSGSPRRSSRPLPPRGRNYAPPMTEADTYFPVAVPDNAQVVQDLSPSGDPLKNKQWLALVKECVALFGELDLLLPDLDPARREMAKHVESRLEEILVRSGVEAIVHDRFFDIQRHKLAVPGPAVPPRTGITEIVSPGFAVRQLVIRPAQVRVDRQ